MNGPVVCSVLFLEPMNERNDHRETATDESHQNRRIHLLTRPLSGSDLVLVVSVEAVEL